MLVRQLFDYESYSYSYLLGDQETGQALLLDPVLEQVSHYLNLLDDLGLRLKTAVDTHCHADHVTALGYLRERTGCETVVGSPSQMECVSRFIADGDVLSCGSVELHALYTPGHTDDSYCFYLAGDQPLLFSGDTLLIRGTGRTDFQNGSSQALYESLFQKVLKLPSNTIVYPGHDYRGWSQSTIAEEIKCNPRLQVKTWQELDEILVQLNLENPKLMDVAIPANLQCGRPLFASEGMLVESQS